MSEYSSVSSLFPSSKVETNREQQEGLRFLVSLFSYGKRQNAISLQPQYPAVCSFSEAPHPLYGTVLGDFQTNFHWGCVGVAENTVQKVLKWRLALSCSYDDVKLYYEYFSYSVSSCSRHGG